MTQLPFLELYLFTHLFIGALLSTIVNRWRLLPFWPFYLLLVVVDRAKKMRW